MGKLHNNNFCCSISLEWILTWRILQYGWTYNWTQDEFGRYYFNSGAILLGNEILNSNNLSDKKLIVIDEVGHLELNGQGWIYAIENIIRSNTAPQLWIVGKRLVRKITMRWNIGNAYIFDITDSSIHEVESKLSEIISNLIPSQ